VKKSQTPNLKSQIISNIKIPMPKTNIFASQKVVLDFEVGYLNLFVIWCLVLGIFTELYKYKNCNYKQNKEAKEMLKTIKGVVEGKVVVPEEPVPEGAVVTINLPPNLRLLRHAGVWRNLEGLDELVVEIYRTRCGD
jgi:hypothetical protein